MKFTRILTFSLATAVVSGTAIAQTVGVAGTKRGFTNQASAAIAKVVTEKTDLQARAQTFGGTSISVPLVAKGQVAFGLANEFETQMASTGSGIYDGRKQAGLRVVAVLTPFRVATFVRNDSPIKSLADLKGKRVLSGFTSQKIITKLMDAQLANAGLTYDDVIKVPTSNVVRGGGDFTSGKSDMFFFVFGSSRVKEVAAKTPGGVRVLGIDTSPEAMARMRKHVPPSYAFAVKPSKRNVGVTKPLNVMAYDYMLLSGEKTSDDIVYKVVKTVHENPDGLKKIFPGLALLNPDRMTKNLPGASYHPGAIKFFKEKGQWPPKG